MRYYPITDNVTEIGRSIEGAVFMTKVKINPGACGLITTAEAISEDGMEVKLIVQSACKSIGQMFKVLGDTFDAYELCLSKPGANIFYDYAKEHLPGHASCPVIAGIVKAAEAECNLALPKNAVIEITKE